MSDDNVPSLTEAAVAAPLLQSSTPSANEPWDDVRLAILRSGLGSATAGGATALPLLLALAGNLRALLAGWWESKGVIAMKLGEAQVVYAGEWIAFRAVDEGENPEGEVILHHKDRRAFDKELLERALTGVYITFAGPPVPEGYAVMF